MKRYFLISTYLIMLTTNTCASASPIQTAKLLSYPVLPSKHKGAVTALLLDNQGYILSAGNDGFLEVWDINTNKAMERFQISSHPITTMILRQNTSHIAIVEHSGNGVYRISAWDYRKKNKLWTLNMSDTVSTLAYSATGSFLIIGENDRIRLVDPETGSSLNNIPRINGSVQFVATGKSERSMVGYQNLGLLSYWNLSTGIEMQHFSVPAHLKSPVMFGTNRFLAALSSRDLLVLDAVSGKIISRNSDLVLDMLIALEPDRTEFMGLNGTTVYHFSLSNTGKLEIINTISIPKEIDSVTSALFYEQTGAVLLGTTDGTVWQVYKNSTAQAMYTENQRRIVETAAAIPYIAFITEEQCLSIIPIDYKQLHNDSLIYLQQRSWDRLSSTPIVSGDKEQSHLLFWQTQNTKVSPLLLTINPDRTVHEMVLDNLQLKSPLQSASLLNDNILFLDTMGNIQVLSIKTGDIVFKFESPGLFDASFWDERTIIMARSSRHNEGMPFLRIDMITGETVPTSLSDSIGIKLYLAKSGNVYAAVVDESGSSTSSSTALIGFDQERLSVFAKTSGEDIDVSIAESEGNLASTLGDEGAWRYDSKTPFARTTGFPVTLVDGGNVFIAVDKDGTVAWHDPYTGEVYALFRLYENFWTLQTADEVMQGRLVLSE